MIENVEEFERLLDREVGRFEVGFGHLPAPVRPGEKDGDKSKSVGAGDVSFQIVADHDGLTVVCGIYVESIEGGTKHSLIGFGDADGFGNGEGIEAVIESVLREDIFEGSQRAVRAECERMLAPFQFENEITSTRDQVRAERFTKLVLLFGRFIGKRVAAV